MKKKIGFAILLTASFLINASFLFMMYVEMPNVPVNTTPDNFITFMKVNNKKNAVAPVVNKMSRPKTGHQDESRQEKGPPPVQRAPEPLSAPNLDVVSDLKSQAGLAIFNVCVDRDGSVYSIDIIRSLTFGQDDLQSLEGMIKTTKFSPALRNNEAVPACLHIKIDLTPRQ